MIRSYKFLFLSLILLACGKSKDSAKPVRKDITQAVYASGKIYPLNDYKVFTKIPGYVEKILVNVGDSVKLKQPVILIRSEISQINVESAKNLYDLASKNASENSPLLASIRAEVNSAKSKYELDSLNFTRFSNLYKENATSRNQRDQAETAYEISRENFLRAFNSYRNTRNKLNVELENARLQFEAQQSNRNDYAISSVMDGKVYDIVPKEGELVNVQVPLMEIGDSKTFEVELSVDETDIALVKKGQEIVYSIDAYKDKFIKGKVMEVYPRINLANKSSKVVASVDLDPSMSIYSGMSVEANIIITQKKNALVIPREYLFENDKVFLKGKEEPVKIQKGAENLEYVEVVSGIDEGSEIVKP